MKVSSMDAWPGDRNLEHRTDRRGVSIRLPLYEKHERSTAAYETNKVQVSPVREERSAVLGSQDVEKERPLAWTCRFFCGFISAIQYGLEY